jgi:mono/diheme cytochrome c family protein
MAGLGWNVPLRFVALLVAANLAAPAIATAKTAVWPSGKDLFQERCATCHGIDATGNGPMAPALKTAPADLTGLTKRAGGTFPAPRVVEIITFGGNVASHGTQAMPVWGKVFSDEGGRGKGGAAASRRSLIALKRYLETIQKK